MLALFFLSCCTVITYSYAFIIPSNLDITNKYTFAQAEEYCIQKFNTNLASIHSYLEYQTVLQLTSELNFPFDFWLGLTIDIAADLTWTDDTKFDWGEHYIYSNNSEIEIQTDKKCATVSWDMTDCNNRYWPICNGNNIIETTYFKTNFAKTEMLTNTKTPLKHKKKGLVQMVLNDAWLLLGVCLFAGFVAIGVMYCFIILFCVCYLNLKLRINASSKILQKNKKNMDFGITIATHYSDSDNYPDDVILGKDGELLDGVKPVHKYKQRRLNIPMPIPKSKSKTKSQTKSQYSVTMHTSVNVRPPTSNQSHLSCTTEDVSLITGLSINGIMKDIIPAYTVDTSTEYYQINNGRMVIGDVKQDQSQQQSVQLQEEGESHHLSFNVAVDEQKIINVIDQDLNADEIAIKENIFNVERNLHLLQHMDREEESEPYVINESDTEYYDNKLFI